MKSRVGLTALTATLLTASSLPVLADPPLTPAPPPLFADAVSSVDGQNAAQRDMARSIDNVCPTLVRRVGRGVASGAEAALQRSCSAMVGAGRAVDSGDGPVGRARYNGTVQAINGEEIETLNADIREIGNVQTGNLRGRMAAIRQGVGGFSVSGLDIGIGDRVIALDDLDDYTILPAQFEGDFLSRVGVFVTGGFQFGEKDATGAAGGFDFDSQGITVGADYRMSDTLAFGGAVGYSRFNSDFDESVDGQGEQELDADSVLLSLFGTFFPTDQLYVDGIATIGWSFYDSERRVFIPDPIIPGGIDDTAEGDFDAFQYGFAGDAGYDIPIAGATVTPLVRVEYLKAEVDGFSESPIEGGLELEFGDQDVESFTTNLGVEAAYPISTGFGIVQPSVRAEYVHEFMDDPDGVLIQYVNDGTAAGLSRFVATSEPVDQDYGLVGAAVTGTFAGGWAAFVDYSTVIGLSNFDIHTVNVGLRKEF